jgi:hypothetical protein
MLFLILEEDDATYGVFYQVHHLRLSLNRYIKDHLQITSKQQILILE